MSECSKVSDLPPLGLSFLKYRGDATTTQSSTGTEAGVWVGDCAVGLHSAESRTAQGTGPKGKLALVCPFKPVTVIRQSRSGQCGRLPSPGLVAGHHSLLLEEGALDSHGGPAGVLLASPTQ